MSRQLHCKLNGYTMVEILFVTGIIAIIVGLAIPSVRTLLQNNRTSGTANEFIAALNYARSEAVKRRNIVRMCTSANGATCRLSGVSDSTLWHKGWIMLDPAGAVLRRSDALITGIEITSTANEVSFFGTGGVITNTLPTFSVSAVDCSGNQKRILSLSATGRVTVTRLACS